MKIVDQLSRMKSLGEGLGMCFSIFECRRLNLQWEEGNKNGKNNKGRFGEEKSALIMLIW